MGRPGHLSIPLVARRSASFSGDANRVKGAVTQPFTLPKRGSRQMRRLQRASVPVIAIFWGLMTTGWAQDMYPNVAPATLDAYMSSHIDGLSLKNAAGKDSGRKNKSSLPDRPATSGSTRVSTSYIPSASVSTQVRNTAIQRVRAVSAADAQKIEATLQKNTVFALWQKATASYGLRPNDMADAMAAYWVVNYMVVNNVKDVPAASVQGARDQFQRLLLGVPALSRQSDATKQRLSEELYYRFLFQNSAFLEANKKDDSSARAALRNSARTRFQDQMGIDLRNFVLTGSGFHEKS